jgi:hypothetical protein
MPIPAPKIDKRLLGTWLSDRRRTLKELRYRPGLKRKHREYLHASFGFLRVRYTRRQIHGVLKDYRFKRPYEVLGRDEGSVAIRTFYKIPGETTGEWIIYHIHFRDNHHYWVSYGYIREWFKKVNDDAA